MAVWLAGGRESTRVGMQPFIAELAKNFQDASTGSSPLRLALFSGKLLFLDMPPIT
jgi:hypothetical protein